MTDLTIQIKPYYIDEIGCDGLSNHDIAQCLGASVGHINRKIKTILSIIPELSPIGIPTTRKGSTAKIYLPTHTAKLIVAKYDNKIGLGYLRFLLMCEKIAQERINSIEAPYKPKLLDKPKTARITESVQKIDTLFGETIFKRTMTRVSEEMLTPLERLQAKRFNLILQAEGVMRKVKKLEAEIDYLQQPASLRLIKS
jgi:hypothetical protein